MKRSSLPGVVALLLLSAACGLDDRGAVGAPSSAPAAPPYACTGYVALTYDDGPSAITQQLINKLDERNMRATFFVTGASVQKLPEVAKLVAERQTIANHTWTHPHLPELGPSEVRDELSRTEDEIRRATGVTTTYWRPPYGEVNEAVMAEAAALGLEMVLWTQDTNDWRGEPASSIVETVGKMKDGDIVLMHDNDQVDLDVLPLIDEVLREKKLCTGVLKKSAKPVQASDGSRKLGLTFRVKAGAP